MKGLVIVCWLLAIGTAVRGQTLTPVIRLAKGCPIELIGNLSSHELLFKSVVFFNSSPKTIDKVEVRLVVPTKPHVTVFDSSTLSIQLGPGKELPVKVMLGDMNRVKELAIRSHLWITEVVLDIAAVDFAD